MKLLIVLILLVACSACTTGNYGTGIYSTGQFYSQAFLGQANLLLKREAIQKKLLEQDLSPDIRERLQFVLTLRAFAKEELRLPVGKAYATYSDLQRPFALWNVYAAPELSLESQRWCYPLAGCFAYRGYFAEEGAQKEAEAFRKRGFDVKVGGILAYSTVGWFDDPVLNTFILKSEPYLVELLFHEMAHRKIYIKNDTPFNENFATAVSMLGSELWYQNRDDGSAYSEYRIRQIRQQTLINLVLDYRVQLNVVFSDEALSEVEKRQNKIRVMQALQKAYQNLKRDSAWDDRYDQWLGTMNNASMATLSNYQSLVPNFLALFEASERDWSIFYKRVEAISRLDKLARHEALSTYQ